ncbi:MAG: hypothetical protein C0404_05060 [Verrucomicrobia bacterium]|nr:hypothetical protein [Verrucomicrobiota bacterium]
MKRCAVMMFMAAATCMVNCACVFAAGDAVEKVKSGGSGDDVVVVLDTKSLWRMHVTQRQPVVGSAEKAEPVPANPKTGAQTITDLPPTDWMKRDFCDVGWMRKPGPFYGSPYGFGEPRAVALLCFRAGFMVGDPAKAPELKLNVDFRGGLRVYLNGTELARKNLREGEIGPETLAEDYPPDAYVTADGAVIDGKKGPTDQKDRCEQRIRRLESFAVPAKLLVKGLNVLAIEVHRAAIAAEGNKPGGDWSSVGVMRVRLVAAGAGDVTPNLVRPKGLQVWAANAFDIVRDVDFGDPCETPKQVSLAGVRNGEFCGVVVVSSDSPIKGLKAEAGELQLSGGGGKIPSSAVRIVYALPGSKVRDNYGFIKTQVNSYDSLMAAPPAEVAVAVKEVSGDTGAIKPVWGAVQPVWFIVKVPSDAKPGDYDGKISIRTEGGNADVGIRLKVINWILPEPKDYRTFADFIESPESVAMRYDVPLWSEKHFALIDKSLAQLGRIGTKTVYLNLISKSNLGNTETIVRWIKKAGPSAPSADSTNAPPAVYEWDFAPMEKYLDLCEKRFGRPWVVTCFLWDIYLEGGWHEGKTPGVLVSALDPQTGKVTEMTLPKATSAEGQPIWKAFGLELQARLKKRGLEKSMMLGMAMDAVPSKAFTDYWKTVLPDVPWVAQGHGIKLDLNNSQVGYCSTVWNAMGVPDPAGPNRKEIHGWQFPQYLLRIGRKYPKLVAANDRDFGYKPYELQVVDGRLKGEHNIHGQSGFGRMSADFWPCIKDAKGNVTRSIASRFPFTDWKQLNLTMIPFLAAGPDGALPTIRFEMIREGVQECEARISIDEALIDKTKRAKLGDDLAQKLQALLDVRTRAVLYDYQTGWQYRSEALYSAAAEVAGLLGAK